VAARGAPAPEIELRHPLIVRVTHWIAVVAILVMAGSGLRIFNAYPAFHRKGQTFCCYPFEGREIPAWLTYGGWLGGARHWHFAMMWILAVNGLVYMVYVYLHGEWRDLVPRRGDIRDSVQMIRFYLFLRAKHPHQGKHNALQKSAYFAMPWVALFIILTGIAIWKPVELEPLTMLFGGYVWARYWHFMGMVALLGLAAGHVFMVFTVDPYVIPSMITGKYDERYSPERRNARPLYHLLPRWARRASAVAPTPVPAAAPATAPDNDLT
jgi:Ni/Fe-hydrogenase b-type cytochrome subunit